MRRGMYRALIAFVLLLPICARAESTESKDPESRFTRIRKNSSGVSDAVETSVASYRTAGGVDIDLISAIHVGEKQYYAQLNSIFQNYDAVLFELIAPDGYKLTKNRKESVITSVQRDLQEMLDLGYQLDEIDYGRPNFVHADVSPDEFFHDLQSSNFSLWDTINSLMSASMAQRKKRDPVQDLKAFLILFREKSNSRTYELRTYLAEQFEDAGELVKRLEGVIGDAIVSKRNSRAISVLKKEIQHGKKRLAIFYGAAHMPDMERRLREELHAQPGEVKWLCAWALQEEAEIGCRGPLTPPSMGAP